MPSVILVEPWLNSRDWDTKKVTTLVMHATAGGSATSSINHLRRPKLDSPRGYSYHAIGERDGTIYKCVPLSRRAVHAGRSVGPNGKWCNDYSLGYCLANMQTLKPWSKTKPEPYTQRQFDSAVWWASQVKPQFPNLQWVTTHYVVSPGRKFDPCKFEIELFATAVGLEFWGKSDL